MARRWLSSSEVVQVEAKMANLVHTDIAVEDWGMATFTFANGIIATLEASWTINAPRKSGPSPKQNSVVRLEVVGTRGEIIDSVVPLARALRARRRRRRLGLRAAIGRILQTGVTVPARSPH
jgi:predicted dehydrogenase